MMTKVIRIRRMTIHNFKNLVDFELNANGMNATIRGRNGTGKTSVADAYFWLTTGKMSDGKLGKIKRIVDGVEITGEDHFVEVEFDNGAILRKELTETKSGDKAAYFVDGVPFTESKYKANLDALVPESAFSLLSNLFAPVNLHWEDLRRVITGLVGDVEMSDVLMQNEDFEVLREVLTKCAPEVAAAVLKAEIRGLRGEATKIPAVVKENQMQIDRIIGDKAQLEKAVDELSKKYDVLTAQFKTMYSGLDTSEATRMRSLLNTSKHRLSKLKQEYRLLKAEMPCICPVCGQKMNYDAWLLHHERRMAEVSAEGKRVNAEYKAAQAALSKFEAGVVEDSSALETQLKDLRDMLIHTKTQLQKLVYREELIVRNEQLRREEVELHRECTEKEYLLSVLGEYQRKRAELVEDRINAAFECVKFKLFDKLKSGDIKACCTPMLNGVPYSQLSSGEKFKAACDILKTLQKHNEVELPVFIDDAESYTSNSLINLPNQKIWLMASEYTDDLEVEY